MDSATREALISVCETLKAEAQQLASIHTELATLTDALLDEIPNFELRLANQTPRLRGSLAVGESVRLIDALLKQLRNQ